MPLYAISLDRCSSAVQRIAVDDVFSEWRADFEKNDISDESECLAYFLKPEKGQIKTLYVVVLKDQNLRCRVIGTVGISTKDFNLHISNLLVFSDWRHKGFGKQLLRFAEDRCKTLGLSTANLWCSEDLMSFYENVGWLKQDKVQIEKDRWVQTLVKLF